MNHQDLKLPRFCIPLILKDKDDMIGKVALALIATCTGYQLYKFTLSSWEITSKSNSLVTRAKNRRVERDLKNHEVLNEVSEHV